MTKKSRYRFPVLLLLCSMAWAACTQTRQECLIPKIASLNVECIHLPTDTATIFVDTALPYALLAAYSPIATQYYIYRTQTAIFTLSLSSDADSCTWGFTTDTLAGHNHFDKITFHYQRRLQFLSNACGYADFYNLDSVNVDAPNGMIDSAHIINSSVNNNVNTKHLQVYIHPGF